MRPPFFSVDPHQANLQHHLFLFNSLLHFNPTPTFLGVIFDRTLSFSKLLSSLKSKFFPRLKALLCISAFTWSASKNPSLFCIKLFFHHFSHMLLACPPSCPWNLASITVESSLSCLCSRFDPPPSRQDAFLAHLHSLISRSGALDRRLCSFSFWK